MPFLFEEHRRIKGLYIITPHSFIDCRGEYKKVYEKNIYAEHGLTQSFNEASEIVSDKGVLRGLHFQIEDSQAKLLHVIRGSLFDVAVDLRVGSPSFGEWASFTLSGNYNKAIFIPEGFAHGFLTLENQTIFAYQCSGKYIPASCGGIAWDDPTLAINWPLPEGMVEPILSEKDKNNMSITEFAAKFANS